MKIRLSDEFEQSNNVCPTHGCSLVYEDGDEDGAVYVCPVEGCRYDRYEGLSRDEVYRRDHGMGGFP